MTHRPLKWYKQLATTKRRLEAGAFLVEGQRAIDQIVQHHPQAIREIVSTAELPPAWQAYPRRSVTPAQLRAMAQTQTPQGLLAVIQLPLATYHDALPVTTGTRVLLLEDVQDPGNVGTLIRTATAFGFSGVILSHKCADPFAPKCVQATAGTILSLWLRRTSRYLEMLTTLQQQGYTCVAADVHGTASADLLARQSRLVLALGNEGAGLSTALLGQSDACVSIPLSRYAESLNVAVCGAICMYVSTTGDLRLAASDAPGSTRDEPVT
jgi:TrmH family RNA methyltransferase